MFQATCSDCGRECEVPFRPVNGRPVFCSNCFKKDEDSGPSRFDSRDSGRPSFGEKRMFQAECAKCGKSCEVPFRPTGEKPVYCRDCFGGSTTGRPSMPSFSSQPQGPSNGEQLRAINAKLDQILKALGATTPTKVVAAAPKAIAPAAKKAEVMPVAVEAPKTEKAEKAEKKKKAVVKKAKPAKK
jgi:CxxC-x17-CxxC domain-containing protein